MIVDYSSFLIAYIALILIPRVRDHELLTEHLSLAILSPGDVTRDRSDAAVSALTNCFRGRLAMKSLFNKFGLIHTLITK